MQFVGAVTMQDRRYCGKVKMISAARSDCLLATHSKINGKIRLEVLSYESVWQIFDAVGWGNFDRPQGEPTSPQKKEEEEEEREEEKKKEQRGGGGERRRSSREGEEKLVTCNKLIFLYAFVSSLRYERTLLDFLLSPWHLLI